MRGALVCFTIIISFLRIIPAYAGSTSADKQTISPARDHPRVCGEHVLERQFDDQGNGSSPRMRGARQQIHECIEMSRIIPAYAGSTGASQDKKIPQEDHPRVCGEHDSQTLVLTLKGGSYPRMRGALLLEGVEVRRGGIIPAYAGSTPVPWRDHAESPDHPRVCGEHLCQGVESRWDKGSSPRMRGARLSDALSSNFNGIIPAYAGSTIAVLLAV